MPDMTLVLTYSCALLNTDSASYETRDLSRHIVKQRRISFLYAKQSFNVHVYEAPVEGLCILHAQVEATADGDEPTVNLPPFLDVERQLTDSEEDKKKYGAYSLSIIKESV